MNRNAESLEGNATIDPFVKGEGGRGAVKKSAEHGRGEWRLWRNQCGYVIARFHSSFPLNPNMQNGSRVKNA